MNNESKLMAFRPIPDYPYLAGGYITEFKANGQVAINSGSPDSRTYGCVPLLILPEDQGTDLLEELSTLTKHREEALLDVKAEYDNNVLSALNFNPFVRNVVQEKQKGELEWNIGECAAYLDD